MDLENGKMKKEDQASLSTEDDYSQHKLVQAKYNLQASESGNRNKFLISRACGIVASVL